MEVTVFNARPQGSPQELVEAVLASAHAAALAEQHAKIQSLKQQRAQLELLARNQEWTLAPDGMTADQHAAAGGAYFDREGVVHQIGEREPDGECWLWVVPNAFKQAIDSEVARESEHQAT